MKRSEQAALKAYPEKDALNKKGTGHYDPNYPRRKAYQQGYEQAEKELGWHSVKESLPPVDEEVIVLTDILSENSMSIGFGKIAFGHRPNPKGWDGKGIATGKVTHYDVVTYDGWNVPGVKYWMPFPKKPKL